MINQNQFAIKITIYKPFNDQCLAQVRFKWLPKHSCSKSLNALSLDQYYCNYDTCERFINMSVPIHENCRCKFIKIVQNAGKCCKFYYAYYYCYN